MIERLISVQTKVSKTAKKLAKDVLPPILLRKVRLGLEKPGSTPAKGGGREQDPKWYDESFKKNNHWKQHYTRSRYYPLWAVVADRMGRAETQSVLDLGCGPGQFASLLRDKEIPSYLGLDFSPKRIQRAKRVCPEFDFVVADAFETDLFHTHEYDTVVCTEFLEHVERDLELLDNIRSGTFFYGTVPNFPFESHVRHFEDAQKVRDRYARFFREFRVDEFFLGKKGRKLYVIEGKKS